MRPSPVIQSTQEAIASLQAASFHWGRVFDPQFAGKVQVEAAAEGISRVYEGFQLAYGALPRFRTEPALRRFYEAMRELERALNGLGLPLAGPLADAAKSVRQGTEQAEAAFAGLTGKVAETSAAPKVVYGAVQRLRADRGYGFVRPDGSETDLFFDAKAVQGARFSVLRVGQAVGFRVAPDPRVPGRMQAIEVQPLR